MNFSPDSSWFYAENGDRKGPVSLTDLRNLLSGGLSADSLVWTEGMNEWMPASAVSGLLTGAAAGVTDANPYAAPASQDPAAAAPAAVGYELPPQPIPLDFGYCFGQGWKYTLSNFGTIMLFGFVYVIISVITSVILEQIVVMVDGPPKVRYNELGMPMVENSFTPFSFVMDLVSSIISIFLGLGATRWGHRFLNGENPPIGELFSQGSKLLPAVIAAIVYLFAVIIGLLLLIIPGIIIAIRLSFYQQAIVEKNLGAIESLKYSWELTRSNGLNIFVFGIIGMLIGLAGALALLIGLLWAIPTVSLAYLIAFRYLHHGKNAVRVLP